MEDLSSVLEEIRRHLTDQPHAFVANIEDDETFQALYRTLASLILLDISANVQEPILHLYYTFSTPADWEIPHKC